MKIRYRASLTMLSAILAISAFSGYINYRSNVKLIESAMHQNLKTVSTLIQVDIDNRATQAASLASLIVNDQLANDAFIARDRDKLIQVIVPPNLIQKEKFGIIDGHYHLPNMTSYLRVYKPQSWGDDLSTYRELILATQKQRRALKGIEISATGVSIKGVDIIQRDGQFYGSYEVGISFETVLEAVKKITGFDAAAFVNNEKFTKAATKAPPVDAERIIGGYRNIFATNWASIQTVATPKLLNSVNDITFRVTKVHGEFNGLVIVPLLDFKGEQIGSIWALGDFSQYQKELRTNVILSISFALLQVILLSSLVLIVFSSFFLLPIEDLISRIEEISEGKLEEAAKVERWASRKDELGAMARAMLKWIEKIQGKK